jgi:hypothetical protein
MFFFFFRFVRKVGVEGKWGVLESEVVEEKKQITPTEKKQNLK